MGNITYSNLEIIGEENKIRSLQDRLCEKGIDRIRRTLRGDHSIDSDYKNRFRYEVFCPEQNFLNPGVSREDAWGCRWVECTSGPFGTSRGVLYILRSGGSGPVLLIDEIAKRYRCLEFYMYCSSLDFESWYELKWKDGEMVEEKGGFYFDDDNSYYEEQYLKHCFFEHNEQNYGFSEE